MKATLYCYLKTEESSPHSQHYAQRTLVHGEEFFSLRGPDPDGVSPVRLQVLNWCAISAVRAEQFDGAKEYARCALAEYSQSVRQDHPKWPHSVLGLVALKKKEWAEVEKQLLTFENIDYVEIIDLELANALIKVGRTAPVMEYVQECKKNGHWRRANYAAWLKNIGEGKAISLV